MRKIIFSMHTSLDGFVAGPKGEMNWIKFDNELFDFVDTMTANADTALYGRVTYEIMQNYWPNAGKQPNASKHEKEHAAWYSKVNKVVLSTTLQEDDLENTKIIADQIAEQIHDLKSQDGDNILIFGSPSATQTLLRLGLIDEFWLFVNPVLIGQGISLFKQVTDITHLNLIESKSFTCGVIALHYGVELIKV